MVKKRKFLKLISFVLVFLTSFSILVKNSNAELTKESIVDSSTYNTYKNIIDEKNTGQVWTDKSVFNSNMTIENNDIKKETDEEFLVSLSALSVGLDLNVKEGNVKDIVILQDLSGSMENKPVVSGNSYITRLQSSKNGINKLLEIFTDINESLSSDDEKFRIGLVGFSDEGAARTIFDLVEPNNSNLATIQSTVNGMTASGETYITEGLNLVFNQLQTKGRKNVDSAIISFLDGDPTKVADGNNAIAAANTFKNEYGITMYSIIVNDQANGGTSTNLDRMGQGLSSNYEHATSPSDLGTQTGNTYYYIPKTADDLINAFKNIIKSIQRRVYTLEENSNLTFTDKLGDYMEVNRIKALIYNGTMYSNIESSTNDKTTTYTFSNTVTDSLGLSANTNTIKIDVTKSDDVKTGDMITVTIPFNLVPLAVYDVSSTFLTNSTVYTTSLNSAKPISIIYSTNVKNEVYSLFQSNESNINDYINNNGSISNDEGNAYFYSNFYKSGENGTTEVIYTPYRQNDHYYYTEDTYLYIKNGNNYTLYRGTTLPNETYYTKKTIYKTGTKIDAEETYEIVKDITNAQKDSKNYWYFKSGIKKEPDNIETKKDNASETAPNSKATTWNTTNIKTLLGNNGATLIHMEMNKINIKVTKVWKDSNDKEGRRPKRITIKLKANGTDLGDKYEIILNEENNWTYTYQNLPKLNDDGNELEYSVVEIAVDGYQTTIEGSQDTGFIITNTPYIEGEIENPPTGAFISIIEITALGAIGYTIWRYAKKHNRFV